jgi:hypothetical protein
MRDLSDGYRDLLDDMLDGRPVWIVTSPPLRRDLRRRLAQRWSEEAGRLRDTR